MEFTEQELAFFKQLFSDQPIGNESIAGAGQDRERYLT